MNQLILGLIINPIAGMGGAVGLKGTDGGDTLEKALSLGAKPNAYNRTKELLEKLSSIKRKIKFITCPKYMGGFILEEFGFDFQIIKHSIFNDYNEIYDSTSEYTKIAANMLCEIKDLKLILFVGGDGTARDIQDAINTKIPALGIPAGVKIFSSVFALNPIVAADLIMQFLWDEIPLKESEVLDIDEEKYRKGKLVSKLYGYLLTPFAPKYSQLSKMESSNSDLNNQERIAKRIIENLEDDVNYILGPGTTIKAITDILDQEKTVLGVDLLLNKKIQKLDLNENDILKIIEKNPTKIIISPIGRQGFLFGRGNLQISSEILKKIGLTNIIILSTKYKLDTIPDNMLKIDTRDIELDRKMKGYYKIIVDYDELKIYKVI